MAASRALDAYELVRTSGFPIPGRLMSMRFSRAEATSQSLAGEPMRSWDEVC
jgi:hypothetical protein